MLWVHSSSDRTKGMNLAPSTQQNHKMPTQTAKSKITHRTTMSSLDNKTQVRGEGTTITRARGLLIRIRRREIVRKLARTLEVLALVIRSIRVFDLFCECARFVRCVRDTDEVAPCDAVERVACCAYFAVDLKASSDTVGVRYVLVSFVGIFRDVACEVSFRSFEESRREQRPCPPLRARDKSEKGDKRQSSEKPACSGLWSNVQRTSHGQRYQSSRCDSMDSGQRADQLPQASWQILHRGKGVCRIGGYTMRSNQQSPRCLQRASHSRALSTMFFFSSIPVQSITSSSRSSMCIRVEREKGKIVVVVRTEL